MTGTTESFGDNNIVSMESNDNVHANTNTNDNTNDDNDDIELIKKAMGYYNNQCYYQASHCLHLVRNQSLLTNQHKRIIEISDRAQLSMKGCLLPFDESVLAKNGFYKPKQTDVHNNNNNPRHPTSIHYKVDYDDYTLTTRIDSIIDCDLLIPLIAVLNESDLYDTWMPKWKFPFKLGVRESIKLGEYNVGHQIIQVTVDMPFPICDRQVILHTVAIDCIDVDEYIHTNHNAIMISIDSMDTGTYYEMDIDKPPPGVKRIDMECGLVIRPCPDDHPLLPVQVPASAANHKTNPIMKEHHYETKKTDSTLPENEDEQQNATSNNNNDNDKRNDQHQQQHDDGKKDKTTTTTSSSTTTTTRSGPILITCTKVDAHVYGVPQRLINFCTRTVLAKQWDALLQIAEQVRDGNNCNNEKNKNLVPIRECIAKKPEMYGWVEERVQVMFINHDLSLQQQQQKGKEGK